MGREALEDIVYRAQLELYSQPLLVRLTSPVCEVKTISESKMSNKRVCVNFSWEMP